MATNQKSSLLERIGYCLHTPADGLTTAASVETIKALVRKNRKSVNS